jgi:hypothetical protein
MIGDAPKQVNVREDSLKRLRLQDRRRNSQAQGGAEKRCIALVGTSSGIERASFAMPRRASVTRRPKHFETISWLIFVPSR